LPLPEAPAVTVIHASLLTAVQLQPAPAVTVTVPVVAAEVARFDDVGAIVKVHGAAACVTVKVWPPIVIVPVGDAVLPWAATLELQEPVPLPDAPAVTVIQASFLTAVQLQPVPSVTVTVPVVAAEVGFNDVGEIVNVQGAPACVTVNVWPPIVIVPVRELVLALAATL